jgi:hypothetical protein
VPRGDRRYIVNSGILVETDGKPRPIPNSCVIWRITSCGKLAGLGQDAPHWLRGFVALLGRTWQPTR